MVLLGDSCYNKQFAKALVKGYSCAYILQANMISSHTLVRMIRKWQKLAAESRKRIILPKSTSKREQDPCTPLSSKTKKGHFVVYTTDGRRFEIPLAYLQNEIFRDLLQVAEEEFGLPRDGPITLPCDAIFMEYAHSLMERDATEDMKKALAFYISNGYCLMSSQLLQDRGNECQIPICSF